MLTHIAAWNRLGRLAARSLQPGGLTRREKEVLRLLALGHAPAAPPRARR